jgi:hypothetical protein
VRDGERERSAPLVRLDVTTGEFPGMPLTRWPEDLPLGAALL